MIDIGIDPVTAVQAVQGALAGQDAVMAKEVLAAALATAAMVMAMEWDLCQCGTGLKKRAPSTGHRTLPTRSPGTAGCTWRLGRGAFDARHPSELLRTSAHI